MTTTETTTTDELRQRGAELERQIGDLRLRLSESPYRDLALFGHEVDPVMRADYRAGVATLAELEGELAENLATRTARFYRAHPELADELSR